ncbi:MAG TPA: hypothetical protein VKH81_17565 [Candidatus Angelobacter sp.]|nr:hypothetical protein [Candidatus Angelobacter sp.]
MNCRLGSVLAVVMASLMTVGCGMKKMAGPPPPPPPESILESGNDRLQDSLFKGDQAVLSDQDIARILSTQIKVGDRHHMAILNLNSSYSWSEDLADVEAKSFDDLVKALKTSPQLTEVRLLPSLLIPDKRTVPYLREAAARIQADLLFIYTSRIQSFRRDRFLKSDEVHAQCIAEAVLLDVRTGIVVHTGKATENIAMTKSQADANFNETVARAEAEARGKTLLTLAGGVNAYLAEEATEKRSAIPSPPTQSH